MSRLGQCKDTRWPPSAESSLEQVSFWHGGLDRAGEGRMGGHVFGWWVVGEGGPVGVLDLGVGFGPLGWLLCNTE